MSDTSKPTSENPSKETVMITKTSPSPPEQNDTPTTQNPPFSPSNDTQDLIYVRTSEPPDDNLTRSQYPIVIIDKGYVVTTILAGSTRIDDRLIIISHDPEDRDPAIPPELTSFTNMKWYTKYWFGTIIQLEEGLIGKIQEAKRNRVLPTVRLANNEASERFKWRFVYEGNLKWETVPEEGERYGDEEDDDDEGYLEEDED